MTSSNIIKIQQWQEQQFKPWQAQMQSFQQELAAQKQDLQSNIGTMQTIVADLYAGRTAKALERWNSIGLEPRIERLYFDDDALLITLEDGRKERVMFSELIEDLQELLS